MFKNIAKAISGDPIQKILDNYREMVDEINALEPGLQALSDETLKAKTGEFKRRLNEADRRLGKFEQGAKTRTTRMGTNFRTGKVVDWSISVVDQFVTIEM